MFFKIIRKSNENRPKILNDFIISMWNSDSQSQTNNY